MPELLRSIVARLRESVGNRRRAPRHQLRLSCSVAPHEPQSASTRRTQQLAGRTRDLSATGLALILPAVRVGDRYLTGTDVTLRVVLEHPTGPLELLATPVRHEQLGPEDDEQGFLIGVRIKEMNAAARARYDAHLAGLH
ncbi:MAG TPA: PilZ domain-containing protein [Pyrinomonadaceae bacterium]|jgi:c-di-GMP-binding flagellar brake protein YcgR